MNEEKTPWLEKLCDLRRLIQRNEQRQITPRCSPKRERQEKIVSGIIKWRPIDRTAAMVVAKATGLNRPDVFRKSDEPKKTKPMKTEKLDIPNANYRTAGFVPQVAMKDGPEYDRWMKDLVQGVILEINRIPNELTPLAKAMIDSRKALEEAASKVGFVQDDFKEKVKSFLNEIRSTRMAALTETNQILSPLKDIRQFFLGADYEKEIARLREFVELCERLEALKKRGTLDAIGDTILKLAIG